MNALLARHLGARAAETLEHFPVVVVQGARQVGKSTFVKMLVENIAARHVTLDDAATRAAALEDPEAFVAQAERETLVIDEIQRAPELILAIKASVDRNRKPGRFLLTGSSDLLKLERSPDSLAGRAVSVRLHGFSQGELIGRLDDFASALQATTRFASFKTNTTRSDYATMLGRGGYPELRDLPQRLRATWIDGYLERIVQRDVNDISNISDPSRLLRVLGLLAANQAGELVPARVARDVRIPASTLDRDLDLLATLYLIDRVPSYSRSLTRRQVGKPKALVSDSALALRLGQLDADRLADVTAGDLLGPQLEGLVTAELLKQRGWSEADYTLGHFRDSDGAEVDLIIEYADGSVVGVEVKASSTLKAQHFTGLKLLRERLGDRFVAGVVLNTADRGYDFGPRLGSLPIAALWEL